MERILDSIALTGARLLMLVVTCLMLYVLAVFVDYAGAAGFVVESGWLVPALAQ